MNDTATSGYVPKIDSQATDGLLGVHNSLAYRVQEIEAHLHGRENWYGSDGDGSGSVANNLTEWSLTAGAIGVFGTEIQLLDSNDINATDFPFTPIYFDIHRIFITNANQSDNNYIIEFWSGDTTFASATLITMAPYRVGSLTNESVPIDIMMPRQPVGNKIWARIKCETAGATLDVLVGIHAYKG